MHEAYISHQAEREIQDDFSYKTKLSSIKLTPNNFMLVDREEAQRSYFYIIINTVSAQHLQNIVVTFSIQLVFVFFRIKSLYLAQQK